MEGLNCNVRLKGDPHPPSLGGSTTHTFRVSITLIAPELDAGDFVFSREVPENRLAADDLLSLVPPFTGGFDPSQ